MFGWFRRKRPLQPLFPGACALNALVRERNPALWDRVGPLVPSKAFREIGAFYGLPAGEVEEAAHMSSDRACVWMIGRIEAVA